MDVLFPEIKGYSEFDELPSDAKKFSSKVEERVGVPVTLIGTGPGVKEIIDVRY